MATPEFTAGCRLKAFLHLRSLNHEGIPPCSLLKALKVTGALGMAGGKVLALERQLTQGLKEHLAAACMK